MVESNDNETPIPIDLLLDRKDYNRSLFAQLPIGLALTRMNGELIDINPAFARIIGCSVEEALRLSYWDITPKKYAVQEREQLESLKKTGSYGPYEKEYIHKEGHLVPVRLNGLLLKQGDETFIWSSVEDISERVQAERAWRDSEHRFADLVDSLPGMFYQCVYNNGWKTIYTSPGSKEITGYDAAYFTQQCHCYLDLVHPEDRAIVTDALEKVCREGGVFQVEYRITSADGQEKWLLEQGQSMLSNDDHQSGVEGYITDITQRKRDEQTIRNLALHDALTGLVNRYEFDRRIGHALDSSKGSGSHHALLYLDLDRFKVVNDSCGHEAGDKLLKEITRVLHKGLRERDTLARLGGDEFGVLLENCTVENAYGIAVNMVEAVAAYRFAWKGKSFNIGVSIGIAPITLETTDSSAVMREADSACYSAKDLGRNRVCSYDREDSSQRGGDARWVTRINDALSNNSFILYAQPIIPMQTGSGGSPFCELLVRITSTDGNLIPPAHFIPAAERYNVMPAIDRWVVNAGVAGLAQYLADHQGMDCGNPLLSINLSGLSLRSPGFIRHVRDCLDKHHLNPSCVCFEITETVAVDDIAQASRFIEELKKSGCQFALDDFGTGFSSFAYLSELLVDFIKIDGSFVRKLSDGKVNSAIVRSIVDIGKAAGIRTIAEHVENQSQMGKLAELGVDYAQGYLIDHPAVWMPCTACHDRARG